MITLVSVRFGLFDVILHIENGHILLSRNHVRNLINILSERTDNPDSGDVTEFFHHIFNRDLVTIAFQFFDNTLRRFQARLDMFDRSVPVNMDKLSIQNLYLCVDRLERRIIQKHYRVPLVQLAVCIGDIHLTYPSFFFLNA